MMSRLRRVDRDRRSWKFPRGPHCTLPLSGYPTLLHPDPSGNAEGASFDFNANAIGLRTRRVKFQLSVIGTSSSCFFRYSIGRPLVRHNQAGRMNDSESIPPCIRLLFHRMCSVTLFRMSSV